MCHHHVFLGILLGFIGVRVLFRLARGALFLRRVAFYRGRQEGGWGGPGGGGGWRGRGQRGDAAPASPVVAEAVGQRLERGLTALELNKMQRAEFDEVFGRIRQVLGASFDRWAGFDTVFAAIVATSFDQRSVEAAFAGVPDLRVRKELTDGVEHLHNILTDEQRGAKV